MKKTIFNIIYYKVKTFKAILKLLKSEPVNSILTYLKDNFLTNNKKFIYNLYHNKC